MTYYAKTFCCLFIACASPVALAGPLDPPAGPIAPTGKTLTEVEPRIAVNATNTPPAGAAKVRITKPGSYYLTADVVGGSGDYGIDIEASNVTLDLNGFSIVGGAGSLDGVYTNGSFVNVTITNGLVRNWGSSGIRLDMVVGGRFTDLTIASNGSYGLYSGNNSRIEHCISRSNAAAGIVAGSLTVVADCTSNLNTGDGIILGNESTAHHCHSCDNTASGITSSDSASVFDCNADGNADDGFRVSWGCTVERCSAVANTGDGIQIGSYSRVKDCFTRSNGTGIHTVAATTRAKIVDNDCVQNATGIKVEGVNCFVTGNSCSASSVSNYNIVAANRVGTIAVLPSSAAINGTTGGASGTVDAACNYSY